MNPEIGGFGAMIPPAFLWYYQYGYKDRWTTRPNHDRSMKRSFDEYVNEAMEKGWFAEQNLTVDPVQYANGAYEMDGFLAGQIDMGYLGAAPAITKSINQAIDVTVLAAANPEGSALMVDKAEYDAGHITEMANLTGKTIFTPGPSTVQNFLLRLALNQSCMTVEDVGLEANTQTSLYIQYAGLHYMTQEVRNTDRFVIGDNFAHALSGLKTVTYGGAYIGEEVETNGRFPQFGHRLVGARIGAHHEFRQSMTFFANLGYEHRHYGANDPLFLKTRNDNQWYAGLGMAWKPPGIGSSRRNTNTPAPTRTSP